MCTAPKSETTEDAREPKAIEFADDKYSAIGRQSLSQWAQGNIDGFVADFADNAVFSWSSGDSLIRKEGITAYWKERRGNVIDTIFYQSEVCVPLKANQSPPNPSGIWLAHWANFSIRYTNGKSVKMWIHHVFHFNDADEIDLIVQYADRAPIAAALSTK